jgi:uncharacterized protein YaaW (UPF0174 family)
MAENDELDGLLKDPLLKHQDWEFLREFMEGEAVKKALLPPSRQEVNRYIRHDCYGHSLANIFRDEYEPDYLPIVRATGKKLKLPVHDHQTVPEIEQQIVVEIINRLKAQIIKEKGEAAWREIEEQAEEELRRAAAEGRMPGADAAKIKGLGPGGLAAMLFAGRLSGIGVYLWANKIFFAISTRLGLGIGVATAGPIIGKGLSLLLGPTGWAIAIIWTVYDLGNTNWKKLIPMVVAIALLRQELEFRRRGYSEGDDPGGGGRT